MAQGRRLRRVLHAAAGGAVVLAGLASAGNALAAGPGRAAIPDTHPQWASRANPPAVTTGAVNLRVYLAGQDPSGLASFASAVSDPSSAQYGDYLTPQQVQARYGATQRRPGRRVVAPAAPA